MFLSALHLNVAQTQRWLRERMEISIHLWGLLVVETTSYRLSHDLICNRTVTPTTPSTITYSGAAVAQ